MLKKGALFFAISFGITISGGVTRYRKKRKSVKKHSIFYKAGRGFACILYDALCVHRHLFSVETAKILTAFTPLYLTTRVIDDDVQKRFYDPQTHTNKNQFHNACHEIAKFSVGPPMIFLSSLMFWGNTPELRMTGRIFALTIPFVHWSKTVLKNIEAKGCLRPWCEGYSKENRSTGGFPSGHMANVTFMATLFGLREGPRWAIPLSFLSAFVFADFVNCNRHYVSQLVAGSALGFVYAFAANEVIEQRLQERLCIDCAFDEYAHPTMKLTYHF